MSSALVVTARPGKSLLKQGQVELLGGVRPIDRRGDLLHLADRLQPIGLSMLIDEAFQNFKRRSSCAWAKNELVSLRTSLALRNSLTSLSSSFICARSDVVMPLRRRSLANRARCVS